MLIHVSIRVAVEHIIVINHPFIDHEFGQQHAITPTGINELNNIIATVPITGTVAIAIMENSNNGLIKHGTISRPRGFCEVLFALRGSELDFPSPFEKRYSLLLHFTDESPGAKARLDIRQGADRRNKL